MPLMCVFPSFSISPFMVFGQERLQEEVNSGVGIEWAALCPLHL
jgi:hypothetical protein